MDTKALNEKLMNFAGYNCKEHPNGHWFMYYTPDNKFYKNNPPDLVNSLDQQALWIYPKLEGLRIKLITRRLTSNGWLTTLGLTDKYDATNKSDAISFALSVEKLINSMEKK